MIHLAIFASGAGSNAANLIRHFENSKEVKVALIVTNNPHAGVLEIAASNKIPSIIIGRDDFKVAAALLDVLKKLNISWIILAGFLWKIPAELIHAYPRKIVNIHPALLPKYGGKGMYGHHVHEAVAAAGETESGITIHYVDEHYDSGDIIFQARVALEPGTTASEIERRVRALEMQYFPLEVEKVLK
jgi:phosphoribosylglycinamide formyltransferase-1